MNVYKSKMTGIGLLQWQILDFCKEGCLYEDHIRSPLSASCIYNVN